MYDFLESIKESAEISRRELILGISCGVLIGFIIGLLFGFGKNNIKSSGKIIIKEAPKKDDGIVLSREDYD